MPHDGACPTKNRHGLLAFPENERVNMLLLSTTIHVNYCMEKLEVKHKDALTLTIDTDKGSLSTATKNLSGSNDIEKKKKKDRIEKENLV